METGTTNALASASLHRGYGFRAIDPPRTPCDDEVSFRKFSAPAPSPCAVTLGIVAGNDRAHAGKLARFVAVDADQSRVSVRRTQDRRVRGAGFDTEVIDETAASAEWRVVLESFDGLADMLGDQT